MSWHVRVVVNRYADSVRLMSASRAVRERDGVDGCELAMGTPANLELLASLGAAVEAAPGDLVIAVDADGSVALDALDHAEQEIAAMSAGSVVDGAGSRPAPRSMLEAATELGAEANVALISVPGEYATLEAHQALSAGMHVFLFSDHVDVASELELKRRGAELGLLVMGPECGTAMLGGIGLGFANVVRPGSVGIVAAAGTGAQESACLLDAAGAGVSHIVGVGGRDLSSEIGGIMFRQGMSLLAADDRTDTLLLVSKAPAPGAVEMIVDAIPPGVRVVASFVGWNGADAPFEVHATLEAGAAAAAGVVADDAAELLEIVDRRRRANGGTLLGLYSGGSLAHEAATLLEPALGPLAGNVSHDAALARGGHALYDLGEAEYTQGRPHPMVDLGSRIEMLARAGEEVGCVLLDVVLGYGSHPDPAGGLADALAAAADRAVVIAHVCGTPEDPQDAERQEQILLDAGAVVAPSNATAARLARRAVGHG